MDSGPYHSGNIIDINSGLSQLTIGARLRS